MDLKNEPFCTAWQAYVSFTYYPNGIHVSTGVVLMVTIYVHNERKSFLSNSRNMNVIQ